MEFNKGAELDKQIYKEGEPTWGCKWGVLDVQDVKEFINRVKEAIQLECGAITNARLSSEIDKRAGDLLS